MALRRGTLDSKELEQIPHALKRKLAIASWLTIIGGIWIIAVYGFLQISQLTV